MTDANIDDFEVTAIVDVIDVLNGSKSVATTDVRTFKRSTPVGEILGWADARTIEGMGTKLRGDLRITVDDTEVERMRLAAQEKLAGFFEGVAQATDTEPADQDTE